MHFLHDSSLKSKNLTIQLNRTGQTGQKNEIDAQMHPRLLTELFDRPAQELNFQVLLK